MRLFVTKEIEGENKLLVVMNLQENPNPAIDRTKVVQIGQLPDETTIISLEISQKDQDNLKALLRRYNHVFYWQYEYIPGVDMMITHYKLDVNPKAKPIKQKLRQMNLER